MKTRPTPERLKSIREYYHDDFAVEDIHDLFNEIDALTAELEKANADYREARDAMYKVEDLRHQALAYAEKLREALIRISLKGIDPEAENPTTRVKLGVWSIPANWSAESEAREALALPKPGSEE